MAHTHYCIAVLVLLFQCIFGTPTPTSPLGSRAALVKKQEESGHWVDTWVSMPQLTETSNLPSPPFLGASAVFTNSTIRQTIHTSLGTTSQIRIQISNAFGVNDLPISAVTVALPSGGVAGSSKIESDTLKTVTFSGDSNFTIPNGALAVSDPIDFPVAPQSMVTVTMYLAQGQQGFDITSHPGSRTTTWMALGDLVDAVDVATGDQAQSVAHWYFLSAVEAWVPESSRSFAIVGDSITDGRGSIDNENNRWPDLLLARMQNNTATSNIAVINQAAGGNRILTDGLGPNALGRFDRDVLSHPNVAYSMIFEGVNDIGETPSTTTALQEIETRLIWAYKQFAVRAHDNGIPFFGATISPMGNPNSTTDMYFTPLREATRQSINDFIRNSNGTFDAVIDFDKILRDPGFPSQLNPLYNSGDWLHPNVLGYQMVANAFPLSIFQ